MSLQRGKPQITNANQCKPMQTNANQCKPMGYLTSMDSMFRSGNHLLEPCTGSLVIGEQAGLSNIQRHLGLQNR